MNAKHLVPNLPRASRDPGTHNLANVEKFQGIDRIFACKVKSPSRDFLGQGGSLQGQHGERVRNHACHQQRKKNIGVNSNAKIILVKGERIVPPRIAPC
jgi:hypothetical protein